MSLQAGRKLAHYEILEPLGKGGMGEVYRARDTKLGRDVAIKVLPEEFSQDTERVARFEREAKLLASLNHPNIAILHGLEESGDTQFLVMEVVEGETLAQRIARGPVPIDETLALFKEIADGLEAAHEKGVIHRDLKPANVKVTKDGKPKILDFGLAKEYGRDASDANLSESPTMARGTATGVILGTAPYMSPEQTRGTDVDKRTDIWAFGCCLFEALTGTTPFVADTVTDTLARIIEREPGWESLPERTPSAVHRLLRRCLQKKRGRRLQAIGDARLEIEDALTAFSEFDRAIVPGVGEELRARTWKRTALVAIAVALIATGVGLWSLMIKTTPVDRSVTRTVITLPPGHELVLGQHPVAFSPDGRLIAYVGRSGETTRLDLRALDQLDAKPIEGADGARMPFFSPDSQWVGFVKGTELMKVPISGGAPVKITDVARPTFGASWGLDGRIVYTDTNRTGLLRVPAEGGDAEVLTVLDRAQSEKGHRWADVLPGGKAVLFTVFPGDISSFDDARIAVLSLETGEHRVLIEGGTRARYIATGHLIYARAGSLLAVAFDVDALKVKGTPVPVLQGVTTSPLHGSAWYGVSLDGSLLYAPGNAWGADRRVVSVDRDGSSQTLVDTPRGFYGLRLSPDGSSLALAIDDANISLWVYDIGRSTMTRLASGFDNQEPVWAPDGKRVVFLSSRVVPRSLFLLPADGSGEAEQLTTTEYRPGSWSPDGKLLAVSGSGDIWLLSMEGDGAPQPIVQTNFREVSPIFSPNGQWLAYASDESGRSEIYIRPFPGPGRRGQVSTDGGTIPRWKADGTELFYRNGDKIVAVPLRTEGELQLGNPKLLFERPSVYGKYDVMPDGQSFVMIDDSEGEPAPTQLILVQNWAEELKRLVPTEN